MNKQFELEEQYLEEALANGKISLKQFNAQMRDLQRGFDDYARQCADEAWQDEYDRHYY
jgi:hypothetical protein